MKQGRRCTDWFYFIYPLLFIFEKWKIYALRKRKEVQLNLIIADTPYSGHLLIAGNSCNLPTNCLSVFDHFARLALQGLNSHKEPLFSGHLSGETSFQRTLFPTPNRHFLNKEPLNKGQSNKILLDLNIVQFNFITLPKAVFCPFRVICQLPLVLSWASFYCTL